MLDRIKNELAISQTTLVAVSKTRPNADIMDMYQKGQRIFGENRVQELVQKYEDLPKDIAWHMIGHLQRNKVKFIAPFVDLIHSVESIRLLEEIDSQAKKNNRVINCLLQFKIAEEEAKFGMQVNDIKEFLQSDDYNTLQNTNIIGIMGMATFTQDKKQVRNEFRTLQSIFNELKEDIFHSKEDFKEISMGMSGDYKIAIEEGSTMVRIGSLLFS